MEQNQIRIVLAAALASMGLLTLPTVGKAQWSVEKPGIATLPEPGGRATLFIQCSRQGADPAIYVHQPLHEQSVALTYRFDDDEAQSRMAAVSKSGHVLRIWNEQEKEAFAHARRLRVQLRPFVVFDFDLRGIENVAAKLQCR